MIAMSRIYYSHLRRQAAAKMMILKMEMVEIGNACNKKEQVLRPRIKLYVERVVSRYSREEFKSLFRMYPETFKFIMGLIGPSLIITRTPGARKPIDAENQLLLSLWAMATPDSLRSICEKLDVGKSTALSSLRRVAYALHSLAPRFIKWPKGEQARPVMEQFERHSAFPKVLGAVDGTHVPINAPNDDAQSYINRKGYYCIQVQAVCTHELLFTSVFAGNAGCVHDARVFRMSPVCQFMEQPEEYFPENCHLIGDSSYSLHPHLMTPFKDNGNLTVRQIFFNFCLSTARVSIERAFGLWKVRWRRILDCLPLKRIDKIPQFILATCVLHKICILNGDLVSFQEPRETIQEGSVQLSSGQLTIAGTIKRNQIMESVLRYISSIKQLFIVLTNLCLMVYLDYDTIHQFQSRLH